MSKSIRTEKEIAPGVKEITDTRLGAVRTRILIKKENLLETIKEVVARQNFVSGAENIKVIADVAATWLNEQNLPYAARVYYSQKVESAPIEVCEIINKAEFEKKYENVDFATPGDGRRFGGMILSNFIEQLNLYKLNTEYLMAEIIVLADHIENGQGDVIEAAYKIGRITQRLEVFHKQDFNLANSHPKSLELDIKNAFEELGDECTNTAILAWLKCWDIAHCHGNRIIRHDGGKDILLTTFRVMVSKVRKDRNTRNK